MPVDEVLTSLPSHDALIQSQIQAMRSMSDQMAQMGRTVERLANDVQTTRDGVIELKAQDLKATILSVRSETMGAVEKLRKDHEADIKEVASQTDANSRSITWLRGFLLPVSVVASAALTGFVTWLVTAFGGAPPHHP